MRRYTCLILSALISALAISQSIRPLTTLALADAPGAAILHRTILRHAVEEVSSKPLESARTELTTFAPSDTALERGSAGTTPDAVDATDWRCACIFHRRTAPRSSDDGN
jgi:hypothetical protein